MKTTVMRRILFLLLVVTMLLSVAIPAVSAEEPKQVGGNQGDNSKGVWLHAALGSFSGMYDNVDISGQPSVWVNFADATNRTLPMALPTITAAKGGNVRWFTAPPTVTDVAVEGKNYSYRTAKGNGEEVLPGGSVPVGVTTLYSTFDYSIPSENDSVLTGKFVTFYLDWNGINGMFGHCMTCTRSYTSAGDVMFTVESAAVSGLNAEFTTEFESFMKNLESKPSTEQWRMLTDYWAKHPVGGYTFKGWSLIPTGQPITDDTLITNGMSFYAVWEKGTQSNENFSRVDPEAGPADSIHFVNLSASGHATKNASAQIQAAIFPVRAVADITWTVSCKEGDKSLQDTFKDGGQTFTVPHNGMHTGDGFRAVASGKTLTITNLDTTARSFVISASCQSEGGSVVTVPTTANVTFSHSWKLTKETKPTCTVPGKNEYTCDVCGAKRDEERYASHVRSWVTTKQPTCEEPGSKHLVCLYCDEEGETKSIPALGHKYTWVQREAPTCEHVGTKVQVCSVCGKEGSTQSIPALGHLYSWVTTKEATCEQNGTMVQVCQRSGCGAHGATSAISALGHAFAWRTVKEATCEDKGLMEEYCVRSGCTGKGRQVELEALGHTFKWVSTREPTPFAEGVKTSKCSKCGKIVNEILPRTTFAQTQSFTAQTHGTSGFTSSTSGSTVSSGTVHSAAQTTQPAPAQSAQASVFQTAQPATSTAKSASTLTETTQASATKSGTTSSAFSAPTQTETSGSLTLGGSTANKSTSSFGGSSLGAWTQSAFSSSLGGNSGSLAFGGSTANKSTSSFGGSSLGGWTQQSSFSSSLGSNSGSLAFGGSTANRNTGSFGGSSLGGWTQQSSFSSSLGGNSGSLAFGGSTANRNTGSFGGSSLGGWTQQSSFSSSLGGNSGSLAFGGSTANRNTGSFGGSSLGAWTNQSSPFASSSFSSSLNTFGSLGSTKSASSFSAPKSFSTESAFGGTKSSRAKAADVLNFFSIF